MKIGLAPNMLSTINKVVIIIIIIIIIINHLYLYLQVYWLSA